MSLWLAAYLVLIAALVVPAALAALQTWEHGRFAQNRLRQLPGYAAAGPALVVIPCRGVDLGLEDNLATFLRQDYADYRVRFVVESGDDPACAAIRRVMAAHPRVPCELIVAGRAEHCGQKVHNLRAATAELPGDVQFLAFADSDARVRTGWLRALTARAERDYVGAVTGYRWFVPGRPTWANRLVYSINTRSAVFLASKAPVLIWGGSWLLRRAVFERLGIRDLWADSLDDDLVAATAVRRAGLRILFEPGCMAASPLDAPWRDALAFVRRQYLLGRFYARRWWLLKLGLLGVSTVAFWGNVAVLAASLVTGMIPSWIPAAAVAAGYLLTVVSGAIRLGIARRYFPEQTDLPRSVRPVELWCGPLVALADLALMLSAAAGRTIRWRQIEYRLSHDGRVEAIQRAEAV